MVLSVEGLHRILTGLVTNFTSFAPLGTVLVATIGIGTLVLLMLPSSLTFLAGWSAPFIAWLLPGWTVGPGAPTSLAVGGATP